MSAGNKVLRDIVTDLEAVLNKCGVMYHVFYRTKSEMSIKNKLEKKSEEYRKANKKMQDLLALRITLKTIEQEKQEPQLMPIEEFLHGCKITHIDCKPDKIKQLWLDAYERGKANGFCPILLEIDDCFYDSLDEKSEWFDKAKFSVWKSSVLSSNPVDGQTFLCDRFEAVKEDWNDEEDWNVKVVGNDENLPPIDDFGISDESHVYLVEVPVKEPWKVFAYIPMGEWNECPTAEEHMAVAKYWYEKYGAVVAHISNDMIQYYLPKPVTGDTMPLAEEHMGYCDDTIFQGENLTSLAAELKKSTVWCFWWD